MGYSIHHTITVTSWNPDKLHEACAFAVSTGAQVSEPIESAINGVWSFFVAPDGSKEGWEESAAGDKRRDQIKTWLRAQAYDDGSTSLRWFEAAHPEDGAPRVIDHQDKRVRRRGA